MRILIVLQKLPANPEAYSGVNLIVGGLALFLLVGFVSLVIKVMWKVISENLKDFTPKFTKLIEDVTYIRKFNEDKVTPKLVDFSNATKDIEEDVKQNVMKIDKTLAIVKELQNNCKIIKK